jgi:hypothetical protein
VRIRTPSPVRGLLIADRPPLLLTYLRSELMDMGPESLQFSYIAFGERYIEADDMTCVVVRVTA